MKNFKITICLISSLLLFSISLSSSVKAQEEVGSQEQDNNEEVLQRRQSGGGFLESEASDIFKPGQPETRDYLESEAKKTIEKALGLEGSGIIDSVEKIISEAPEIISKTKEVIENINLESLEKVLGTVLGDIGLIDPQVAANNTAILGNYSNPESIEEIDKMAQASDAQQSQVIQRLSQIVFSQQGQEAIAEQNEILEDTQEKAVLSVEATTETNNVSRQVSQNQAYQAEGIANEAQKARAALASQDVLKAIATQKEYEAQMQAGISDQLTLLTETEVYNALQMEGLNTQLTVMNQREQNMQSYFAAQNLQLSEIDNNLEQQISLDKYEDKIETLRAHTAMTELFIPGVYQD